MKSLIYLLFVVALLGCESGTPVSTSAEKNTSTGMCEAFNVSDLDTNIIVTDSLVNRGIFDTLTLEYVIDTVGCADQKTINPSAWVFDGVSCVEIGHVDNGCTIINDSVIMTHMYDEYEANIISPNVPYNMTAKHIYDETSLHSYMKANPTTKIFATELSCQVSHRDCNQQVKYDIYPNCGYAGYPLFSESNVDTAGLEYEYYITVERIEEIIGRDSTEEWTDAENGYSNEYPTITSKCIEWGLYGRDYWEKYSIYLDENGEEEEY